MRLATALISARSASSASRAATSVSQSLPGPDPCGFVHQRGSDRFGLRQALSL